jgi:hypothetical protein
MASRHVVSPQDLEVRRHTGLRGETFFEVVLSRIAENDYRVATLVNGRSCTEVKKPSLTAATRAFRKAVKP